MCHRFLGLNAGQEPHLSLNTKICQYCDLKQRQQLKLKRNRVNNRSIKSWQTELTRKVTIKKSKISHLFFQHETSGFVFLSAERWQHLSFVQAAWEDKCPPSASERRCIFLSAKWGFSSAPRTAQQHVSSLFLFLKINFRSHYFLFLQEKVTLGQTFITHPVGR